MHQIKLFVDIESNSDALEKRINDWLADSGAKVVQVLGNIAPQTIASDAKAAALGHQKFCSSDLFLAIVYKTAD